MSKGRGSQEASELAAETVARHDSSWTRRATRVVIESGDLEVDVAVAQVDRWGELSVVTLHFWITSSRLTTRVVMPFSGYSPDDRSAVIEGACLWTCSFVPVLRRALASGPPSSDVTEFDVCVGDTAFHAFVAQLDRAFATEDGVDPELRMVQTRERFTRDAAATLTAAVIDGGKLPALSTQSPTVLGTMVWTAHGHRIVEVKVNGRDDEPAGQHLRQVPAEPPGCISLLRELAVLVPSAA